MKIEINIDCDDCDCTEEHDLPGKFQVCPRCKGKGTHVNPNVDGHGISREEFDNDPQFFEDYQAGVYDVTCYTCNGLRVVEIVDISRLNAEQKKVYKIWKDQQEDLAKFDREWASEQRMQAAMGGDW